MSVSFLQLTARSARPRRLPGLVPAVPAAVLLACLVSALAAPLITPYDPVQNDLANSLLPPLWLEGGSAAHPLGTDSFGRDVFTRLVYGARVSFSVAAFALIIALTIGAAVGLISGYVGGWLDSILMRIVDVLLSLPTILVGLVVAVALGPSFFNLVMILGLLTWPRIARLIRGEVLLLKHQAYVRYSQAIGVPQWLIMRRHLLPNVLPTLMVVTTLEIGAVILSEASLSFLGAGLPPPQSSWGVMISDGRGLVATGWWIALFPGLAITATVLASNTLGDWLRDHLDSRTRHSSR